MEANKLETWTNEEKIQCAYVDYSFKVPMVEKETVETEDLLTVVEATVSYRDDWGKPIDIAAARWLWVDWMLLEEHRERISEVLDSVLGTTEYIDLIDQKNDTIAAPIARQFKIQREVSGLLIGDRIHVDREYRGFGLARRIIDHAARRFWNTPMIAIKPFPLQLEPNGKDIKRLHRPETGLEDFTTDRKRAEKQLRRYYTTLGFQSIKNTALMGMANQYCQY